MLDRYELPYLAHGATYRWVSGEAKHFVWARWDRVTCYVQSTNVVPVNKFMRIDLRFTLAFTFDQRSRPSVKDAWTALPKSIYRIDVVASNQ